jgi:hypothetical protein
VEALGELGDVLLKCARVRESRVQEYERFARAVLLVIRMDVAELYVVGHGSRSVRCLGLWAGIAKKYDRAIERSSLDGGERNRCVEPAEETSSAPSAMGLTNSQYSSMRSRRMNVDERSALA